AAGGGDEARAVVAFAGFARLHRGDAAAAADGGADEGAGDEGLADAGVGGGDEGASHAPQTSTMEARVASTRRSISSSVMESGGIMTTTGPSGRNRTPRRRKSRQTRAPIASSKR